MVAQRLPLGLFNPSSWTPDIDDETSGWITLPWFVTNLVSQSNKTFFPGGTRFAKQMPPPYLCQKYPDYFSAVNFRLDTAYSVNLTCWTTAPAADKRSACKDNGSAWFQSADGCFIPDYIIETLVKVPQSTKKEQMEELTDILRYCPPPHHQVGAIRKRYRDGTYCYSCPSLDCPSVPLGPANGSVELDCWTSGSNVRGDE